MKLLALALALLIPSSVVAVDPPQKSERCSLQGTDACPWKNKQSHGIKMHDVTDKLQNSDGRGRLFRQTRGEQKPETRQMKVAELFNLLHELYGKDTILTVATISNKVIIFEKSNDASARPGRPERSWKRDGDKPERSAKRNGSSREKYAELGRTIREAITNGEMTEEEGREKLVALRERIRERHDRNNKEQ